MAVAVVGLVIAGFPKLTVSVSTAVPVPTALVALNVIGKTPTAVGVPLISPVLVLTLSPAGSPLAPKLVGELVAVI